MSRQSVSAVGAAPSSVLDRIASILDVFDQQEVLTLDQVARRVGLPGSSVHRILQRLVRLEWVEREGFRYRLGLRMRELGNHVLLQDRVHRVALPHLYELRDGLGFSAHLSVLSGLESVALETIWGRGEVPDIVPVRYPAHATASGKVLLAAAMPESLDWIRGADLPALTTATTVATGMLVRELERVRTQRIAVANEELAIGVVSVAVPIGPIPGATSALAVSGSAGRLRPDRVAAPLRAAAAQIWAGRPPTTLPRSTALSPA
jgi:DNA-binding IclR family transcriptional regulator